MNLLSFCTLSRGSCSYALGFFSTYRLLMEVHKFAGQALQRCGKVIGSKKRRQLAQTADEYFPVFTGSTDDNTRSHTSKELLKCTYIQIHIYNMCKCLRTPKEQLIACENSTGGMEKPIGANSKHRKLHDTIQSGDKYIYIYIGHTYILHEHIHIFEI